MKYGTVRVKKENGISTKILLLVVVYIWVCGAPGAKEIDIKAPEFILKDNYDQQEINSKELRGKVVILIFGTRKGSAEQVKWTKALREKYKGVEDLKVFPIAIIKGVPFFISKERIKNGMKEESPIPLFCDWKGKVTDAFETPDKKNSLVLIDKEGIIQYRQVGLQEDLKAKLYQKIDEILVMSKVI